MTFFLYAYKKNRDHSLGEEGRQGNQNMCLNIRTKRVLLRSVFLFYVFFYAVLIFSKLLDSMLVFQNSKIVCPALKDSFVRGTVQ